LNFVLTQNPTKFVDVLIRTKLESPRLKDVSYIIRDISIIKYTYTY
jgi:hypothetical protein